MYVSGLMPDYSMTQADKMDCLVTAFRFSELPGEIRDDVYRKYFGTWDAIVEYDRKLAAFKISGLPIFEVMLANRAFHGECNHLIAKSFSGRLILRDTKVRRERGFGYRSSLDIFDTLCPSWLLANTQILTVEQGTPSTLKNLPWSKLASLREIRLAGSSWPNAHSYPCGLSRTAKETQEREVFEGKYDTWCVDGFNKWPLVPKPINDGHVRVVTIKQGLVRGIHLEVQLEHQPDCVEVFARSINSVIQPKILDRDRQGLQPREPGFCQAM